MSANTVISIGFKVETADNGFTYLTHSGEALREVLESNVKEADKLEKSFVEFAAVCTGIDSVSSTLNDLLSVVNDLTGAYDIQKEVESQLEQVMRNTMNAREEDIQSIKDFCAEQQKIGIVGDEVQLAGAQELATYLNLKSSLKTLIPVMNDMVAQQYGLAATGENAAQIATMLGKVMNGQVKALSRYGYSFDEAQEKVLKYGTEMERAAMLAKVVSESVGGMNRALAQTNAGKFKQLENDLGDLKETLGSAVKWAQPILTIGANATIAVGGVMKLVQGVKALTVAFGAMTVASGGLSIVLAAVASVFVYFMTRTDEATESVNRLSTAEEREARAAEMSADAHDAATAARRNAISTIEEDIARCKNWEGTKQQEKKVVDELNSRYGETMGYFKSVSAWYDTLVKNSKAYCDQMVKEAMARKYADQIADLKMANEKILRNDDGSRRTFSTEREKGDHLISEAEAERLREKGHRPGVGVGAQGELIYSIYGEIPGTSDFDKATAEYQDNLKKIENLERLQEDAAKKVDMPVKGPDKPELEFETPKPPKPPKPPTIKEEAPEGSIMNLEEQIRGIDKEIKITVDAEEIYRLQNEKITLQAEIKKLEAPIRKAEAEMKIKEKLEGMDPVDIKVNVDAKSLSAELQTIPKVLTPAEKLQQTLGNVSNVADAAGQAFRGMGTAFEIPALDVVGIIAGAIATMIQGYAIATNKSTALGPWGWAAFGLAGLAQLTAMITQIKSVAAFADGGIVSGPTLGLVGEYPGAASNPEVIAPLNKLKAMIGDNPAAAPVIIGGEIKMKGRNMVLVLENQTKVSGISGKRYNL